VSDTGSREPIIYLLYWNLIGLSLSYWDSIETLWSQLVLQVELSALLIGYIHIPARYVHIKKKKKKKGGGGGAFPLKIKPLAISTILGFNIFHKIPIS